MKLNFMKNPSNVSVIQDCLNCNKKMENNKSSLIESVFLDNEVDLWQYAKKYLLLFVCTDDPLNTAWAR